MLTNIAELRALRNKFHAKSMLDAHEVKRFDELFYALLDSLPEPKQAFYLNDHVDKIESLAKEVTDHLDFHSTPWIHIMDLATKLYRAGWQARAKDSKRD